MSEYKFISIKDIITSPGEWVAVGTDVMQREFSVDDRHYVMSVTQSVPTREDHVLTVTLNGGQLGTESRHSSVEWAVEHAYVTVVANYNNRKGHDGKMNKMLDKANKFGKEWYV